MTLNTMPRSTASHDLIIINPEQIPGMPQMLPGERVFDLPGVGLCRHKAADDEDAAGDEAGDDEAAFNAWKRRFRWIAWCPFLFLLAGLICFFTGLVNLAFVRFFSIESAVKTYMNFALFSWTIPIFFSFLFFVPILNCSLQFGRSSLPSRAPAADDKQATPTATSDQRPASRLFSEGHRA